MLKVAQISDCELQEEARIDLVRQYWDAHKAFSEWYEALPAQAKRIVVITNPLNMGGRQAEMENVFLQCYSFSTLSAAHMHMMYWASLQVLFNMLKLTYRALEGVETAYCWPSHPAALRCQACLAQFKALPMTAMQKCHCGFIDRQSRFNTGGLPELTEEHDPTGTASQICMSIPCCLQQDLKIMGPYYTLFPLKMAIGGFTAHLPSTTLQLKWCYMVVEMLEAKGLQFSKKMLRMYEGRELGGFVG